MRLRFLCLVLTVIMLTACSSGKKLENLGNINEVREEPGDIFIEIEFLDYGKATFKLLPDIAPNAVDEFVVKAERGFYDRRNIHRVVPDFIIQGGSIEFDGTDGEVQEGEVFSVETSEFARNFYGAIGMIADDQNRNFCQFYIVTNKKPVDIDLDIQTLETLLSDNERPLTEEAKARLQANLDLAKSIPQNIKDLYATRGGVYKLDGQYTVFGQLVEGSEVIDAIAAVQVAAGNKIDDDYNINSKPVEEIIISSIKVIRIPLPEPTTSETSKKSSKKTTAATTTTNPEDALTEKIDFSETQPPEIESDVNTAPDVSETETEASVEDGAESAETEESDEAVDVD